ncbi:Diguanylate cyclase/phosphodiesterase with PAS/PAC sensor(S) (fragment) [Sterolibacterium denitrificans]|uniref:Diguanylate cyclase/phosphodiesterase with PAS/PAC sensor(S) n=1 Tax=Sterolibacterium denitrificans TaxID=157592 RepID=A0A7Z7HQS0_9PROT
MSDHLVDSDGNWFKQLFEASPDPTWIIEGNRFVECNAAAVRFLGYPSRDDLLNSHPSRLSPPQQPDGEDSFAKAERMMALAMENGLHRFEWMHRKMDGSDFLAEVTLSSIHHQGRTIIYCVWRDITERKLTEVLLQKSESRLKGILEGAADAILITNRQGCYQYANQQALRLLGYSPQELVGRSILDITLESEHSAIQLGFQELLESGELRQELHLITVDGQAIPVELNACLLADGSCFGSCRDIRERKAAEANINYMAHHDTLTGLLNRRSLTERLEQALATAKRESHPLAVLLLDLDRFKATNDTLGHAAGDALLIDVADRLKASLRNSDILARLGGDEFVIVLAEIDDAPNTARMAEKMLTTLGQPYLIDGHQVHITPSIGIAFFPIDGEDSGTLMRHADSAMYHAKSQGRNNVQFFSPELDLFAMRRMRMEHDLREALASRSFELHYQPQVDARSRTIVGVEALVRWRNSARETIMPGEFIEIAEQSGLILPLGECVIDEACRQLRIWRDQGYTALRMAVNLSALQLRSANLLDFVAATLLKHEIGGEHLELEITESMVMDNPGACIAKLRALRDMGIHLAIDDFGTGYSSLSNLRLMPIHSLKIDRSFVRNIESDSDDLVICTATIALAHNLGLKVVAEGVETSAQRDLLAGHGCDVLQGYLFSKPVDAAAMDALLAVSY